MFFLLIFSLKNFVCKTVVKLVDKENIFKELSYYLNSSDMPACQLFVSTRVLETVQFCYQWIRQTGSKLITQISLFNFFSFILVKFGIYCELSQDFLKVLRQT